MLDKALLAQIFTEHDISAVIHFAALKAVGESVEQPLAYFSTNVTGLLCLLEEMKGAGIKHLVFSSSATVYGEPKEVPITENAPLQFTSPYGFTKVASEQILTQAAAAEPLGLWRAALFQSSRGPSQRINWRRSVRHSQQPHALYRKGCERRMATSQCIWE